MKRGIYAIRDVKAEDIVGGLQVFPSDAVAVRFFGDVLGDKQKGNMIAQHPEDFELVRVGALDSGGSISELDDSVVITGRQWVAAQAPADGQLSLIGGDR